MSGKFDLGDYVEVDERIARFYQRYPEGRIATVGLPQVIQIDGKSFIVAQAAAYRTADDPQPCIGTAAEPFPGQTTFTKNSELMNAETSAWGRALVAVGILAKGEKVASRNEVRNRAAERPTNGAGTAPPSTTSALPASSGAQSPAPANDGVLGSMEELYAMAEALPADKKQNKLQVDALVKRHGYEAIKERLVKAAAS